jgi:hypothetical protein
MIGLDDRDRSREVAARGAAMVHFAAAQCKQRREAPCSFDDDGW